MALERSRVLFGVLTVATITFCMYTFNYGLFRYKVGGILQFVTAVYEPAVTDDNDTLRYSTRGILVDGSLTFATKKFNVSWPFLRTVGFPANIQDMTPASVDNVDSFVFVTAASRNHLRECLGSISTVQQYFSNYTLYFYDLDDNTPPSAVSQLQRLCNVVYRKFNFSRYPSHVRTLRTFAFKAIIVHEMLLNHSGVFWIDASARFKISSIDSIRQQVVSEARGVVMFEPSIHSIFEATHRGMYNYLPISKTAAVQATMMSANAIFIRCSTELYESVFRWWFLCALDEKCMAPTRDIDCQFKGRDKYAGCHRFDQAAINILLTNFHHGDQAKFGARNNNLVDIARDDTSNRPLCVRTQNGTRVRIESAAIS